MHVGHFYLFVALLSLGAIGVVLKLADSGKCRAGAVNMSLFFCAAVLVFAYTLLAGHFSLVIKTPAKLYLVAAICGTMASIAILSFQTGLRCGKIASSWTIMNLSTMLPALLSIFVYREHVTPAKVVALVLAAIAVLLLWIDRQLDAQQGNAAEATQR